MQWLDTNNAVLRWGSEELAIPYVNPIKTDPSGRPKISRYYPDFIILYRDAAGNIKKEIVEIKPYKESVITPRMSERDKLAYTVNQAKWKAASIFAEAQGAEFRIVTEKTLFKTNKRT
ncbi:TnsA endonuclease N-terminal domain-containing protein [Acinetobacter sp.]|uniref:TnsA endonuclease N-terminal domain-containing protein n=1 Tax=Acinetobacter sp. TaxID=472 RepID=UPI00388FB185